MEINIVNNVDEDDNVAQFCSVRSEHVIRHSGDIDLIVVALKKRYPSYDGDNNDDDDDCDDIFDDSEHENDQ